MLHLYWGNGKGKTTAAMGLALRALGHGRRVVIVQFLKDGTSGEIAPLRAAGAAVYACPNAKFTWLMDEADKAAAREASARALGRALAEPFDLLVLDEADMNGVHYLALTEAKNPEEEENLEVIILKVIQDEESGEDLLSTVDSDDELEAIYQIFEDQMFAEDDGPEADDQDDE